MKRAVLYMRVSSVDQHPETQLHDLKQMAAQRGYQVIHEYTDRISGVKARRPGLGDLMRDPAAAASMSSWSGHAIVSHAQPDTSSRSSMSSTASISSSSRSASIDTSGPLGRAIVVIIGAIAELERNLIVERVRAGMRRAKLEGRHIGRNPITVDRDAIVCDRRRGESLRQIARCHRISTATVRRVLAAYPPEEQVA